MKPNSSWLHFKNTGEVTIAPSRVLDNRTKVLTLGCGLSHAMGAALQERGITVLPRSDRDALQFFNSSSLRQEFERAFGYWRQGDDDYWEVATPEGVVYQDPYRRSVFAPTPDALRQITQSLDASLKAGIAECDALVLTLHSTEVWRAGKNLLAICPDHPGEPLAGVHAAGYEETLVNLKRIVDLTLAHHPGKKIFVAVSPIALEQTFSGVDVAVANMESKSILRAVAGTLANSHDAVTYFPALETALYRPAAAFAEDGRTLVPGQITAIADLFVKSYVDLVPAPGSRLDLLRKEAPVVDMLRSVLKVEDPASQAVLDSFVDSYQDLTEGGAFTDMGYYAMRQIYTATHGQIDDIVSAKIGELFPPPSLSDVVSPLFGKQDKEDLEKAVASMRDQGFYKFDGLLPEPFLKRLQQIVANAPRMNAADPRTRYIDQYFYDQEEPWDVVTDPAILQIVSQYFGCQPVFDFITAYRSFPTGTDKETLSRAAQMFHFDKDRLVFLKVFVYLTDVTPETGPHIYVSGSHRNKPDALWQDGRRSDEEVETAYPPGSIQEITGPAGTVFLADTRGYHKGMPVQSGERVLMQFHYSISLAGKEEPVPVTRAENRFVQRMAADHPRLAMHFQ